MQREQGQGLNSAELSFAQRCNPVSTGNGPQSLAEWAFRARPGLWRICLCPQVARMAEHKFGNRYGKVRARASDVNLVWNLKGRGSGQQNFDFSRQISEKFRIFQAISRKMSIIPGKFLKNFKFFQAHLWKISIFSGNFSNNFDFFRQFLKNFDFSRQKLLIYSYFWANYSISLQKSPLSNILPVHDKI